MLEPLLDSEIKEKALLYICVNGESYPREIAKAFGFHINAVQNQLLNLEKGAILYSKLKGRVRLFGINPRYPFKKEIVALLEKALSFYPENEKSRISDVRLRPRRTNKPI
ncbi:MAG: hypothetical protein NTW38_05210 [Candidatus Aminicenantes bacterium]|nr:hypothetical protein [Candidatus Aminicenantes bacterium]